MRMFAWLTRRLFPAPAPKPAVPPIPSRIPRWAVVANAARDRRAGPGGQTVVQGTKHFTPGAKLTVVAVYWGMGGETVTVVGRHRKSNRYITIALKTRYLVNVRPELVYSPHLVRQIEANAEFTQYPAASPEAEAHATKVAEGLVPMSAGTQDFNRR